MPVSGESGVLEKGVLNSNTNDWLGSPSPIRAFPVQPVAVLWTAPGLVHDSASLLRKACAQALLETPKNVCILKSDDRNRGGLLLDFGRELHGGIEIVLGALPKNQPVHIRVRFGESAIEAMSELNGASNATNDHAVRDDILLLPSLGSRYVGDTGFRFVYIGLAEPGRE